MSELNKFNEKDYIGEYDTLKQAVKAREDFIKSLF